MRAGLAALSLAVIGLLVRGDTTRAGARQMVVGEHVTAVLDGAGAWIGPDSARLVVRVVTDYECTACEVFERQAGSRLRAWARQGRLRYQVIHAPVSAHRRARKAAVAFYCAMRAGRGWPMHSRLIRSRAEWGWGNDPRPVFERLARAVDVPVGAFSACLDSEEARRQAAADAEAAKRIGVESVPVVLLDSTLVRPSRSFREILEVVERRMRHRGRAGG